MGLLPPKHTRQTVLFSATFPQQTSELCKYALRPDMVFVDTVGEDTEATAARVCSRLTYHPPYIRHAVPVKPGHRVCEPNLGLLLVHCELS